MLSLQKSENSGRGINTRSVLAGLIKGTQRRPMSYTGVAKEREKFMQMGQPRSYFIIHPIPDLWGCDVRLTLAT